MKTLLEKVYAKEFAYINGLPFQELQSMVSSWFQDDILPCEAREDIQNDYMQDFMRYREGETEGELLEYLKN